MTDDPLAGLQLSPEAFGPDPFTAPVPDPEAQMDAIRKRHGEGRHKTLSRMIAEAMTGERRSSP